MIKERQIAVFNVTNAFLDAERAAENAAASGARFITIAIEERRRLKLHPATGSAALRVAGRAVVDALSSHGSFAEAHSLLTELRRELHLPHAYGPDSCPPNEGSERENFRIVA